MSAAQNSGKGKCCQVYPKHIRDSDADDASSNSLGPEQVFARAKGRNRRTLHRTTSWRYHPRPRELLARPQSERCLDAAAPDKCLRAAAADAPAVDAATPEKCLHAAAVASAAAAVPPSWLKSNSGADLLLLAAGVRGGNDSEAGCGTTRHRSASDSTAVLLSSAPSSSTSMASLAREAHRPREQPQGQAQALLLADRIFDVQDTEGGVGDGEAKEEGKEVSRSRSASGSRETQPATAGPAATPYMGEKWVQLLPSWLKFGSRRRTPRTDETSLDIQHPPVLVLSPPQSPSAAEASPLPSSTAKRSFRSAVSSSFRRRKRPSKPSRGRVGGKAVVAAALAYGRSFEPAQGEQTARVRHPFHGEGEGVGRRVQAVFDFGSKHRRWARASKEIFWYQYIRAHSRH